jgi:pyruvate-formate lyase-activating enzyme
MMREYGCELDCTYTWNDDTEEYDLSECTYETPGDDSTPAVCAYDS